MKKFSLFLLPCVLLCATLQAAPDADRLALAHEVIKASKADAMFDQMVPQFEQMMKANLAQAGLPADKLAQAEKAIPQLTTFMVEKLKELMTKMDGVYAETFTVEELKAMKAFYESPEGRSMVEKSPQVMKNMMPLLQQMQKDVMTKTQEVMQQATSGGAAPAAPAPGAE